MTIVKIFSRRFFWGQPQVSSYNRLEIIEEELNVDSWDPEHLQAFAPPTT